MGSSLPPIRGALTVFHRIHKILQSFGLKLARDVAIKFLQRLVFWLSAKFHRNKMNNILPKDRPLLPENTKQQDLPYTVIRDGETVSLRGVALSLYPFSSGGIRNTSRASVRASPMDSRNASRSSHHAADTDYAHSDRTSFYELELNPVVHRPPSRLSRAPSRLRNPRRQFSTSLPELADSRRAQFPPSIDLSPYSRTQSPAPGVDIELASPVEVTSPNETITGGVSNPYARFMRNNWRPTIVEQARDAVSCPSPPPGIAFESTSPKPAASISKSYSETSLRVPSVASASSVNHYTNSISSVSSDLKIIKPLVPEKCQRYARRTRRSRTQCFFEVAPVTTVFDQPASPPGWLIIVHPEGFRYFHHPVKRVYTDSELCDPQIYAWMMDAIDRLDRLANTLDRPSPPDAMLVIDVIEEEGKFHGEYYYAVHSEKTVFWLHSFDTYEIDTCHEVYGPETLRHLGLELRAQYWFFVQLYPNSLPLTLEVVCELRDILLHYIGDVMTSPTCTSPYTLDVLFQILTATDGMEKNVGPNWLGATSLLGRHMFIFTHQKFLDCHGETYARIDRDFSIYGDDNNKRTWLIQSLSLLLFSAPEVHLRGLQKLWVDGILHVAVWLETAKKLNDEWQEFVFFATVMLTSNVGYLAIQSVDVSGDGDGRRSAGQIASYLSIVANMGSIILGLLLMRQNRTKIRESADDVQKFLMRRNHPMLGLETLAILYSLPYALLMWGVVAFLVAFFCIFFENATIQSRSLVGSLSVAVAALIAWCITISWETVEESATVERPLAYEHLDAPRRLDHIRPPSPPSSPPAQRILELIKSIPNYVQSRRKSEESDKTVV